MIAKALLWIPVLSLLFPVTFDVPIVNHRYMMPDDPGIGHLDGTAWDQGNIVLAGHDYGLFADLDYIEVGQIILLLKSDQAIRFKVQSVQIVDVTETHWLNPTNETVLTLITCEGNQRRIIRAIPYHSSPN